MKKRILALMVILTASTYLLSGCGMELLTVLGTVGRLNTEKAGKAVTGKDNPDDVPSGDYNDYGNALTDEPVGLYDYEVSEGYAMPGYAADEYAYEMIPMTSAARVGMAEPEWNTEEYRYYQENGWSSVKTQPFSTFAADVDTASYANLRRMILDDNIYSDAVRIEEMINYFSYDYPEPVEGEPFSVTTEIAPCPWNDDTQLLLVGLKAQELDLTECPPSNLVFLIDVSGSMDEPDKLPLVQRAFRLLAENLRPQDRVSIVTYASGDTTVLDGVHGDETAEITDAIEDLSAWGGTDGSKGIITAYGLAKKNYLPGGNNRVILATDGDFNVGVSDEAGLTRLIKEKAAEGVYLSVLGFGTGNYADTRMEALADNGNGNYSYIDNIAEARRVLVQEIGGTLFTVAKDVKLQVEFNPAKIKGYRLIGYENRTMAAEDFADDKKDGGEIGAGHSMTALYEIAAVDSAQEIPEVESRYAAASSDEAAEDFTGEFLTVNVRYKEPDGDESTLLVYPVTEEALLPEMSENMAWAAGVAETGMLLRQSEYLGKMAELSAEENYKNIYEQLSTLSSVRDDGYRKEFLYLVSRLEKTGE